jgi:hypothetical protein
MRATAGCPHWIKSVTCGWNTAYEDSQKCENLSEIKTTFSQRIDLPVSVDSDPDCLAQLILYAL